MKKLVLLLLAQLSIAFTAFSQKANFIQENDVNGFQYKSFYQKNDTISGVLYYSNKERAMYSICKLKTNKDIPNWLDAIYADHDFLKNTIPKVQCGKRTFAFSFLYENGGFYEIRIIHSDYVLKKYHKTIKRLRRLIQKMAFPQDDPYCIYLYEITWSIDAQCAVRRVKQPIIYLKQ
ncbi:MAG: hypothetical protein WCR52_08460 [Bacteroidota bacterium]|uniref:hypothetical protein n=1 Tax=Runella sp. TaxID=1960881 RepID=UPI00301668E9